MSKGSARRPPSVPKPDVDANWERTFGSKARRLPGSNDDLAFNPDILVRRILGRLPVTYPTQTTAGDPKPQGPASPESDITDHLKPSDWPGNPS